MPEFLPGDWVRETRQFGRWGRVRRTTLAGRVTVEWHGTLPVNAEDAQWVLASSSVHHAHLRRLPPPRVAIHHA